MKRISFSSVERGKELPKKGYLIVGGCRVPLKPGGEGNDSAK
ncbi:MAG: hypothetical protein WBQ03_18360 [Candidatus Sulfotelmatobacter sp.]